ncbi:MAG: DMT family transporter [Lachnospiraceae bacterium]
MFKSISNKNKGIMCILCAAFCFALMGIFVRLSGDLPSVQKSFFRNIVALVFAVIIMVKNKVPFTTEAGNLPFLFGRAAFGTMGILCNFYAVDHLMVADASMLNKLSPFFAIVFSALLLKEKVKPFQIVCVVMAFVGMLFIIKPGVIGMEAGPALVGALGGLGAGIAYTFVRMLGQRGVKGPFIVFFFSAFSSIVVMPFLIFDYHPMDWYQLLMLILAGLSAAGGQFSITAAYTFAPAREISVYDYSQIIFSTLLSFFILGQVPDGLSFVGYAIICAASILVYIYNNKGEK